jgi:Hsp70 protein
MLFQIEEPDGTPIDEDGGPGAAVGIDLAGARGAVAIALGGNAEILAARDGSEGPEMKGLREASGHFVLEPTKAALLALRGRAERALTRPVTHAVIAIAAPLDPAIRQSLAAAAAASELIVTRILTDSEATALAPGAAPALAIAHGAAIAAEDDAFTAAQRANNS